METNRLKCADINRSTTEAKKSMFMAVLENARAHYKTQRKPIHFHAEDKTALFAVTAEVPRIQLA